MRDWEVKSSVSVLLEEKEKKLVTALDNANAGNDACLNDGVLLTGERAREAEFLKGLWPRLEHEEGEKPGGDIETGNDTDGEAHPHDDEVEHNTKNEADD